MKTKEQRLILALGAALLISARQKSQLKADIVLLEEENMALAQEIKRTTKVARHLAHMIDTSGIDVDEFDRIALQDLLQ